MASSSPLEGDGEGAIQPNAALHGGGASDATKEAMHAGVLAISEAVALAQQAVADEVRIANEALAPVNERSVLEAFGPVTFQATAALEALQEAMLQVTRIKVKEAVAAQEKKLRAIRGASKSALANKETELGGQFAQALKAQGERMHAQRQADEDAAGEADQQLANAKRTAERCEIQVKTLEAENSKLLQAKSLLEAKLGDATEQVSRLTAMLSEREAEEARCMRHLANEVHQLAIEPRALKKTLRRPYGPSS